jgi:ABC-2 type transport system permease protein
VEAESHAASGVNGMINVKNLFSASFISLVQKEFVLILRNGHLLFLLIFPTTIQLVILGFALNPGIQHMRVAVVDECRTALSRSFTTVLTNTGMFQPYELPVENPDADAVLANAQAKAVVFIPRDFQAKLDRFHLSSVQMILDGSDAYTAGLARGYLTETALNSNLRGGHEDVLVPNIHMLFNPALLSPWYFVPGVLGGLLTLSATLVSSAVMLRERESGTLEQLLMLPVTSGEIFIAKVLPIYFLLMIDLGIALLISRLVFALPILGNLFLFLLFSSLYIIVVIAIGVLLGTFCKNQRQAKMLSFFVNIPLLLLSGILVPLNAMPDALKALSLIDPLRYYQTIARGMLLKGVGPDSLGIEVAALAACAAITVSASILRFRENVS